MRTRCSRPIPRSRKAFPHRSTLAASSPYVTLWPWQRMATLDSRTPRCEATNVSAALYRAGSSIRRGSPTRRIMSRPGTSRRVELDVRVHHLGMLALQPVTEPREEPFGLSGRDVVQHGDAREHEELVRAHLDGAEIDDLLDSRFARDRGAEPVEDLLGRSLADDQPARAPGELVRDVDEDDADHRAGERIEAVIARQHGEPEPQERGHETGERRAVFVQDRTQSGIAQLLQESADRYVLSRGGVPHLAHGHAQREGLEDHREPEHDEADPHHTELLRVRESLVRLVDR